MMTPFLLARCSFLRWVIKKYIKLNSLILEMFLFLSYYYNICRAEKRMDFFLTFNLCFEIVRTHVVVVYQGNAINVAYG